MYNNKFKSGFVTIIGRPNVGKSTLLNHLIGEKIAIMSNKPQTTRNKIQCIYTNEEGQIVFIDTPGIHKPHHKLGEYMVRVAENTLNEVDLILYIVEPGNPGKGDQYIMGQLNNVKTPVVLLINKIDTVKKEEVFSTINSYRKLYDFREIIPISAYEGKNTDTIMEIIFENMKEGPLYFPDDMITDQPEKQIIAEYIREKALHCLDKEIPHGIAVVIERYKLRDSKDIIDIDATIICERNSHKGIIIGKQGSMLKKIGTLARKDIENLLGSKVNLQLWVKVKNNWRDSEFLLKNFGYNNKEL